MAEKTVTYLYLDQLYVKSGIQQIKDMRPRGLKPNRGQLPAILRYILEKTFSKVNTYWRKTYKLIQSTLERILTNSYDLVQARKLNNTYYM